MTIIQAIILGLVQGVTEFIPVSSSGHLVLTHYALGVQQNSLLFDLALHLGTLLALLIFFNTELFVLAKALFVKSEKTRLARFLVLATVPAVIAGMLLESLAESSFRSPRLVAMTLIFAAGFMLLAERIMQRRQKLTKLDDVTLKQTLVVGAAQAAALVPGVSRSGSTITFGIIMGLDRVSATRFSFLLGIPITAGAIAKVLLTESAISTISSDFTIFAVGIVTAFVSGIFAIKYLLKFLAKHSLDIFAYYRIVLGISALLLLSL
jgi:undecaprenyl-diphosphatase